MLSLLEMPLGGELDSIIHPRQGLERGDSREPLELMLVVTSVGLPRLG